MNMRKIAHALSNQVARHIRKLGDVLRAEPDSWTIPESYALHMSVTWPDPMVPGRVSMSASINACIVRSVFAIDESAKLLRTSLCARLRSEDGQ